MKTRDATLAAKAAAITDRAMAGYLGTDWHKDWLATYRQVVRELTWCNIESITHQTRRRRPWHK